MNIDEKVFKALAGGISQETWDSYNNIEKNDYIKKHPNSNYAQKKRIAYHGSIKLFDSFDNSYISTGNGQLGHGYGFYFSKMEDNILKYANNRWSKDDIPTVYEIDLPSDKLFLDENKSYKEQSSIVKKAITKVFKTFDGLDYIDDYSDYSDDEDDGATIYENIVTEYENSENCSRIEAMKKASLMLNKFGCVGVKYYANTLSKFVADTDGDCYVIFDKDNVKIIGRHNAKSIF